MWKRIVLVSTLVIGLIIIGLFIYDMSTYTTYGEVTSSAINLNDKFLYIQISQLILEGDVFSRMVLIDDEQLIARLMKVLVDDPSHMELKKDSPPFQETYIIDIYTDKSIYGIRVGEDMVSIRGNYHKLGQGHYRVIGENSLLSLMNQELEGLDWEYVER